MTDPYRTQRASWLQDIAASARELGEDARTGTPEALGSPVATRGAAARTERAPLWHGTAFLVEALVLLAFLTAALAVFAQLFASTRTEAARGAELSEAVAIAQNAAERFAAAADPAALDGATTATGPQTGNAYSLVIDIEPTEQAAGTLWTATIYVDRTPAAASGAAGGQDRNTAADSQAAASTASPSNAAAQTESLTIYTLTTARYVPEGEVA